MKYSIIYIRKRIYIIVLGFNRHCVMNRSFSGLLAVVTIGETLHKTKTNLKRKSKKTVISFELIKLEWLPYDWWLNCIDVNDISNLHNYRFLVLFGEDQIYLMWCVINVYHRLSNCYKKLDVPFWDSDTCIVSC